MANKDRNGWRGWAALVSGLGAWGVLLLALWAPLAGAEPCPANVQPSGLTKFLADPWDTQPANGRTPLILVHGINGTDSIFQPNWNYWQDFRSFFHFWGTTGQSLLKDKFKLYAFFYEPESVFMARAGR